MTFETSFLNTLLSQVQLVVVEEEVVEAAEVEVVAEVRSNIA